MNLEMMQLANKPSLGMLRNEGVSDVMHVSAYTWYDPHISVAIQYRN